MRAEHLELFLPEHHMALEAGEKRHQLTVIVLRAALAVAKKPADFRFIKIVCFQ